MRKSTASVGQKNARSQLSRHSFHMEGAGEGTSAGFGPILDRILTASDTKKACRRAVRVEFAMRSNVLQNFG